MAVSTPKGLVVPVLRNVDQMSFADVEKVRCWVGHWMAQVRGTESWQGGLVWGRCCPCLPACLPDSA